MSDTKAPLPNSATRPVILIVDDNEFIRHVVAVALKAGGYDVIEAGDGRKALAVVESGRNIDVVVTDVCMPNTNGFSLADDLRKRELSLPVIFVSAFEVDPTHVGPYATVLQKPFLPHQLLQKVAEVCGRPAIPA